MALETWIDDLCAVWDSTGVRSFRVFNRAEFPETIDPKAPSAISYPLGVAFGDEDVWDGVTEFHVTPNTIKTTLPDAMRFFEKVRTAAAAHLTLGGKVSYFQLKPGGQNIQGPLIMQYGEEAPHYGLKVFWTVKERSTIVYGG